jgi:hypothetical protein
MRVPCEFARLIGKPCGSPELILRKGKERLKTTVGVAERGSAGERLSERPWVNRSITLTYS